jgi:hypothetical protein
VRDDASPPCIGGRVRLAPPYRLSRGAGSEW